jgi:hypothetical protein
MSKLFKLSPSDLTFLYSECPRCFYLKVKEGLSRPRGIMPTIFIKIDGIMKDHFEGKSPRDIDPSLPTGKVILETVGYNLKLSRIVEQEIAFI